MLKIYRTPYKQYTDKYTIYRRSDILLASHVDKNRIDLSCLDLDDPLILLLRAQAALAQEMEYAFPRIETPCVVEKVSYDKGILKHFRDVAFISTTDSTIFVKTEEDLMMKILDLLMNPQINKIEYGVK